MAVEAKARNRPVVQGKNKERPKAGMNRLLNSAMKKSVQHPYIIFGDLSLPPYDSAEPPDWLGEMDRVLSRVVKKHGGVAPFDLVVFTNTPHEYGQPGEKDPTKEFGIWRPQTSRIPLGVVELLLRAVKQYGNLPRDFPEKREIVGSSMIAVPREPA